MTGLTRQACSMIEVEQPCDGKRRGLTASNASDCQVLSGGANYVSVAAEGISTDQS